MLAGWFDCVYLMIVVMKEIHFECILSLLPVQGEKTQKLLLKGAICDIFYSVKIIFLVTIITMIIYSFEMVISVIWIF